MEAREHEPTADAAQPAGEVQRLLDAARLDRDVAALVVRLARRRGAETSARPAGARTRGARDANVIRAPGRHAQLHEQQPEEAAADDRDRRARRRRRCGRTTLTAHPSASPGNGRRRARSGAARRGRAGPTRNRRRSARREATRDPCRRSRRSTPHPSWPGRARRQRVVEPRSALPQRQARRADAAALEPDEHLPVGGLRQRRRATAARRRGAATTAARAPTGAASRRRDQRAPVAASLVVRARRQPVVELGETRLDVHPAPASRSPPRSARVSVTYQRWSPARSSTNSTSGRAPSQLARSRPAARAG